MKHVASTVLAVIATLFTYQFSFSQDYVVSITGDTLRGTVKPINFGPDKKVLVIDSQKKKTQLTIFKVRAYSLKGEIYNPVRMETGYQFMKLMKSGYLSLYAFIPDKQSSYDGRFLLKKDGRGMEIPNLSFKKMMAKFLDDCPAISTKIENGDLSKKHIDQIIDEYNKCIDDNSHTRTLATSPDVIPEKATTGWDSLEQKVKTHADFEAKTNAIEMIEEIKNKVRKSEKVPNFLIQGLTNALAETDLKDELAKVLRE